MEVDMNKFSYVYQITEISTNKKYIGSRGTSNSNLLDDLKKYKSSSLELKEKQTLNPNDFYYEILSVHNSRDEAYVEEERLHNLYNVKNDDEFYNKCNHNSSKFNISGRVTVKDEYGNTSSVNINDHRYLSGELVSIAKNKLNIIDENGNKKQIDVSLYDKDKHTIFSKNKIVVKDKNNNILHVDFNDPRYLSGELVGIASRKIVVKDANGETQQIDVNDARYLSGELVPTIKDKIMVKDKDNNYYQISKFDPRYLSGELVGIAKNEVVVVDKEGNKFKVAYDDPRYLSGELVGHTKGYCTYKDKNGNKVYTHKNDDRVKSGELVGLYSGLVSVKDKDGNRFKVNINDPRYLSGELVNVLVKNKISINGTIYPSIKFAMKELKKSNSYIKSRIESDKEEYKDWFTIEG